MGGGVIAHAPLVPRWVLQPVGLKHPQGFKQSAMATRPLLLGTSIGHCSPQASSRLAGQSCDFFRQQVHVAAVVLAVATSPFLPGICAHPGLTSAAEPAAPAACSIPDWDKNKGGARCSEAWRYDGVVQPGGHPASG